MHRAGCCRALAAPLMVGRTAALQAASEALPGAAAGTVAPMPMSSGHAFTAAMLIRPLCDMYATPTVIPARAVAVRRQAKKAMGVFEQDCWSARDEEAIAVAREAFSSGRKASVLGPKRCVH